MFLCALTIREIYILFYLLYKIFCIFKLFLRLCTPCNIKIIIIRFFPAK